MTHPPPPLGFPQLSLSLCPSSSVRGRDRGEAAAGEQGPGEQAGHRHAGGGQEVPAGVRKVAIANAGKTSLYTVSFLKATDFFFPGRWLQGAGADVQGPEADQVHHQAAEGGAGEEAVGRELLHLHVGPGRLDDGGGGEESALALAHDDGGGDGGRRPAAVPPGAAAAGAEQTRRLQRGLRQLGHLPSHAQTSSSVKAGGIQRSGEEKTFFWVHPTPPPKKKNLRV